MSQKIIERFLAKQVGTLEQEWTKEKEQEIITLHNAFADTIEQQKPHSSTLITVLRIIEHETLSDALQKIKTGKPAEEVLKQHVTKRTKMDK